MTISPPNPLGRHRRSILWIVGATILMVAASVIGSIALMMVAAGTLDQIESQDERELVQRTIENDLKRMTRELTSASVWNDAVKAVDDPVDQAWADVNFAEYYSRYFGHDLTFVVRDGAVIYASAAGTRTSTGALRQLPRDVSRLVDRVSTRARETHAQGGHGLEQASTASGLIKSGDEIYLVVAGDILSETAEAAAHDHQAPAVLVSVRRAGTAYVRGLRENLGVDGLTLTDRPIAGQIVVPLFDTQGNVIATAQWPPRGPGMTLLRRAAPWIGAVFLALLLCAGVLFVWVAEALRRLEAGQRALIDAKEAADAANTAKTQFLANMSHEIRTPLNGVLGMTQIMEADQLSDPQRDRLAVISASGQALLALLNDILDMARLEARAIRLRSEPFDLGDLIEGVCLLFSGAASAKGIALTWQVSPTCTGRWIGDPVRLRQVLSNLLGNAVKFTDYGEISVHVDDTARGLRFEVRDTGRGVEDEDLPRLFKIFSQVDGTSTRAHDGSGLGLAISQQLVALMGGEIRVESVIGAGSVFQFELPLQRLQRANLRLAAS